MTSISAVAWELLESSFPLSVSTSTSTSTAAAGSSSSTSSNSDSNRFNRELLLLPLLQRVLHSDAQRKLLEAALELLDSDSSASASTSASVGGAGRGRLVQELVHVKSGRAYWRVSGAKSSSYFCVRNYCSCPSFAQIATKEFAEQRVLCKHLLAIRLAKCFDMVESRTLDSEAFLAGSFSFSNNNSYSTRYHG